MTGQAASLSDTADALFASLGGAPAILVAVSGGPDSVALLHLLAAWRAKGRGPNLVAATVDHGLRAESSEEAAMVAGQCAALGIPHRILPWTGAKPRSRLQEAAREKRYELLLLQARRDGASHLATAHTLDDQAETILMRLARGSGVAGLAGMRPEVDREGIRHVRPLLGCAKADLAALCRREGWPFVDDPSNVNERFARARWRKLMPALAAEGLTSERLAQLAERARRADEALDAKAREALSRIQAGEQAAARVPAAGFGEEPFEIAVRMVGLLLREGRAPSDHLRLERLEAAVERLRAAVSESRPLRLTLGGRLLDLGRDGSLRIRAEPLRHRGRYPSGSDDDACAPASLGKGGRHA